MDNFRTLSKTVTQQDSDAGGHTLICGESGTGMSVYLEYLMHQDIGAGQKILLIDPWGDLSKELSKLTSENTMLIDISKESANGLCNIFHASSPEEYDMVAQKVIDLFAQIYDPDHRGIIGPRFEFAVRNVILALLYAGIPSFENMYRAMVDTTFVQSLLTHVPDGPVRQYWSQQMSQTSDFHKSEILDYVVSKFGIFMQNGPIKNILDNNKNNIDLVKQMEKTPLLCIDTSAIRTNSPIATIVYMALGEMVLELVKVNTNYNSIYIDEVDMFDGSDAIIRAFEEGKRSRTKFTVVTRDLENMRPSLRSHILRFGTIVAFRQAVRDSQVLAEHFLDQSVTYQSLAMQKKYSFSLRYVDGGEIRVSTNNSIEYK